MILAIDPGSEQSAFAMIDEKTLNPTKIGKLDNYDLAERVRCLNESPFVDTYKFAIEMVASYGMPVGAEVFETCVWIGRFLECANCFRERQKVYRKDEKMNLCHTMKAKDGNIRQALIDRFGPVGTKKNPGWFYGFSGDVWQAYAVGITYADMLKDAQKAIL